MKTEIINVKGDWTEVLNDCRSTVGKGDLDKDPSNEFKLNMVICEHSPIRDIRIKWRWNGIKSWIATHFSRHSWECFIKSQRTDRTGVNRDSIPQDAPVTFTGEVNIQNLIDTSRKRLCYMADKETRVYWEDLVDSIKDIDENIWLACVPNCIYRGGCPEMHCCGYFNKFFNKYGIDTDIKKRYAEYKEFCNTLNTKEE